MRELQQAGRYGESIPMLRELLTEHPGDAEASYLVGVALVRTGEPTLAHWWLARAAATTGRAVDAGLELAAALIATENYEASIEASGRVLEGNPDQLDALGVRARARVLGGRFAEALADAERVLARLPDDLGALEIQVRALQGLGRDTEAEEALSRLSARAEGSTPWLAARACVAGVGFRRRGGEAEPAEAELRDCLASAPADPIALRHAVGLLDAGGSREAATRILRAALTAAPEALVLRAGLAERLASGGQREAAEGLLVEATELAPSAQSWYALAEFHRRGGAATLARSAFERAVELAGDEAEPIRFAYADFLIGQSDLERAEAVAAGLKQPMFSELLRGRILLERGDAQGALAAVEVGIRLWPNNPAARHLAGVAAEALGDWQRALSEYREALRAGPGLTDAALALARLHRALGEPESALEFARWHVRTHPGQSEGSVEILRAATALGERELAEQALARLQQISGAEVVAVVEGAAFEQAVDGPDAVIEWIDASGLDLSEAASEPVLRLLVEALLAQGRGKVALRRIEACVARRSDAAWLHDVLGRALARSGAAPEEARSEFERALAIDPAYAPSLAGLAHLAWQAGDSTDAISLFDRAAGIQPGDPEHAYAAARLELSQGSSAQAEARLRALVARHPYHAGSCNDLAWLLAERREDLDLALTLAIRASRLEPTAATFDTLGWVRLQRGEFQESLHELTRAVELAPERPSLRYRRGLALEATGDLEGARLEFGRVLEAAEFPEREAARVALARLSMPREGSRSSTKRSLPPR